ncbi:MAG: hypoxanthine phosphoribosyltransferase [bacterium]
MMSTHAIALHERSLRLGEIIISGEEIQRRVHELGAEISRDYAGKVPVLVTVLRGGVLFLADLMRAIEIDLEIDFMAVSSYGKETRSSGVVRIQSDLTMNIEGRDVIIVEDIVDTGLTLAYIREALETRQPTSLRICALLDKKARRETDVRVEYVGFDIPDKFVVGYGLDFAERYRNLPHIVALNETAIAPAER